VRGSGAVAGMLPFVLATMAHAQAPSVPAGQGAAGAVGGASAAPTPATPVVSTAASDRESVSRRFQSSYLLGDWGGVRTDLWEAGFEPTLLLITDPYGNPVGGREQGFTTYNLLCADLGVDAGRAAGLRGGRFDIGFSWNFGNQLSQDVVGNVFPIQSADVAPPGTRLTNLSWTQDLLDGALSVRAGRFSIDALYGQEFAGSNYFRAFTSVAFNAIPFSLFYNAPGPFGYPATTWGARVKVQPNDTLCLMGGHLQRRSGGG
jgi:porin